MNLGNEAGKMHSIIKNIKTAFSGAKKCFSLPGTLTVETAVVLPLFLFAMVSLLYINETLRYSNIVQEQLHESAKAMSAVAYGEDKLTKGAAGVGGGILSGVAISQTYVASRVSTSLVKAGIEPKSISYLRSKYNDKGIIDLVAVEELNLPFDLFGIGSFRFVDRARIHAFTGYEPGIISDGERDDEEIVYITASGEVYHRNRNCPHLNIKPSAILASEIEKKRNSSGGKYYPCEYCQAAKGGSTFYVTAYGDRYHTTVACQGLKRDVRAIPLSQVGGRRACKTCGF